MNKDLGTGKEELLKKVKNANDEYRKHVQSVKKESTFGISFFHTESGAEKGEELYKELKEKKSLEEMYPVIQSKIQEWNKGRWTTPSKHSLVTLLAKNLLCADDNLALFPELMIAEVSRLLEAVKVLTEFAQKVPELFKSKSESTKTDAEIKELNGELKNQFDKLDSCRKSLEAIFEPSRDPLIMKVDTLYQETNDFMKGQAASDLGNSKELALQAVATAKVYLGGLGTDVATQLDATDLDPKPVRKSIGERMGLSPSK